MIIFPAIDIKDGKVVRLLQGKFDKVTEYSDDPVTVAQKWQDMGAQWLHLVDLDGAKTGEIKNMDVILNIAKSVNIPVQMGGGVRRKEDIGKLIEGGVSRVILGTIVLEDTTFLVDVLSSWRDKIAVSLDCSDGFVAHKGWTETSRIKATEFVRELEILGVPCIIYTDIARDGMLTGPNYKQLQDMCDATSIPIIASGGISNIADIKKLAAMEKNGIMGCITGKAIYEGKLNLKEALKLC